MYPLEILFTIEFLQLFNDNFNKFLIMSSLTTMGRQKPTSTLLPAIFLNICLRFVYISRFIGLYFFFLRIR